jgi:hypothetical protein
VQLVTRRIAKKEPSSFLGSITIRIIIHLPHLEFQLQGQRGKIFGRGQTATFTTIFLSPPEAAPWFNMNFKILLINTSCQSVAEMTSVSNFLVRILAGQEGIATVKSWGFHKSETIFLNELASLQRLVAGLITHAETELRSNRFWCVSSNAVEYSPSEEQLCFTGSSADVIDTMLPEIARQSSWAIIPWGVPRDYEGIMLITREEDLFRSLSTSCLNTSGRFGEFSEFVISDYEINDARPSELFRATLFLDLGNASLTIMRSESTVLPFVFGPSASFAPYWPEWPIGRYDQIHCDPSISFGDLGCLTIYRPHDSEAILRMANVANTNTIGISLGVVSGSLSPEEVILAGRIWGREFPENKLKKALKIGTLAGWYYEIGGSGSDECYALHAARQSKTSIEVQKALRSAGTGRIVTCF